MRLLAEGRDAQVFDAGGGLVLRRFRTPHDTLREAAVMHVARSAGVPVPAVHEVTATDMLMDRVDGPNLLDWALRRPVPRLGRAARLLADLHRRVAAVAAPEWLPAPVGPGDSLLHLDLHPLNVLVSEHGPVIIDWTNAARGPAAADVAQTWVIMATSEVPGGGVQRRLVELVRGRFVRRFLEYAGSDAAVALLPAVAAFRTRDPNVTDRERDAVRRLVGGH